MGSALAGLCLFCVATGSLPAAQEAERADPFVREGIGEKLHDWLVRAEAYGMHGAVLVEQEGEVVLRAGYGLADRASGRKNTAATRFAVGSLGKQFTAAAVASLVERGLARWESPLAELLPDVPADKAAITLHQLLTHTAGLPYQPTGASLLATPLVDEPGTRHAYSNVGYGILVLVVEHASGRAFEEVCAELFERAGAGGIVPLGRAVDAGTEAHGYVDGFDHGPPSGFPVEGPMRGAGGFACTVDELHAWIRALDEGRVLSKETVERMFTDHVGRTNGYGYGWFVLRTMRGTPLVRHMGDHNGFNAELRLYRGEDRTIVFLSNVFEGGRSLREAVVNRLALMLAGRIVPEPPRVVPGDPAEATRLTGAYVTSRGRRYVVSTVDGEEGVLEVAAADQDGANVLFGVAADVATGSLVQDCAVRTRALLQALREGDADGAAALANPAWVGASADLAGAFARLRERCGEPREPRVVATAVLDPVIQNARTLVELSGDRGSARLELVWTRRGALGCRTDGRLPARRFLRTRERSYAAFDLFTGKVAEVRFSTPEGIEAGSLELDSGPVRESARRAAVEVKDEPPR